MSGIKQVFYCIMLHHIFKRQLLLLLLLLRTRDKSHSHLAIIAKHTRKVQFSGFH